VGADGATHAGNYDIAYLRCIPNMSIMTPADENECRQLLYTAFLQDHPTAVRYPRGKGVGVEVQPQMTAIPLGKGEIRRRAGSAGLNGRRIAILAFGTLLYPALAAAEKLDATVANMRFAKPLDVELLAELAASHDALVTIEDGCLMGGAGSAVDEALSQLALTVSLPILHLGLPDEFVEHGDPAVLMSQLGLDAVGIEQSILRLFGGGTAQG
jgi:1-deoxy-D-xylulose-5-phosphate synthase